MLTLVFVTFLSLSPRVPSQSLGSDKLNHLLAYAAVAFPIAFVRPSRWLSLLFLCAIWSGLIELLQPFVLRSAEWLDLIANIGGILVGATIAHILLLALGDKFPKSGL